MAQTFLELVEFVSISHYAFSLAKRLDTVNVLEWWPEEKLLTRVHTLANH